MKNINRFTEPENLIEQSGSLKLKWAAVIAVIGITLLIFLSGCQSQKKWIAKGQAKGWLSADTFYIKDTVKGFDTTVIRQFDTLNHTDTLTVIKDGIRVSTIVRWKDRIIEQTLTKRDTVLVRQQIRTVVTQIKKSKWWNNWILGFCCGLSFMFLILWSVNRKNYVK